MNSNFNVVWIGLSDHKKFQLIVPFTINVHRRLYLSTQCNLWKIVINFRFCLKQIRVYIHLAVMPLCWSLVYILTYTIYSRLLWSDCDNNDVEILVEISVLKYPDRPKIDLTSFSSVPYIYQKFSFRILNKTRYTWRYFENQLPCHPFWQPNREMIKCITAT